MPATTQGLWASRTCKTSLAAPYRNGTFSQPSEAKVPSRPEYQAELMPEWRDNPERPDPSLPYYGFDFVRFANGHSDHVQGHYTGWLAERHEDPDSLRGKDNALAADHISAPTSHKPAKSLSLRIKRTRVISRFSCIAHSPTRITRSHHLAATSTSTTQMTCRCLNRLLISTPKSQRC